MRSLPMIGEAVLRRHGLGHYTGKIIPGEVFAWEPDLAHARELCVVTRVQDEKVWTRSIDSDREVWNHESRFREAVVATCMRPHPVRYDPLALTPLPDALARHLK